MISHCANPDCKLPFHYLRGGRLYRFDVRSPSEPCQDVPNAICSLKPSAAAVYFWLCERCCAKFMLTFEPHTGVILHPLSSSGARIGEGPVIIPHTSATS